jgi:hypothetical protein
MSPAIATLRAAIGRMPQGHRHAAEVVRIALHGHWTVERQNAKHGAIWPPDAGARARSLPSSEASARPSSRQHEADPCLQNRHNIAELATNGDSAALRHDDLNLDRLHCRL